MTTVKSQTPVSVLLTVYNGMPYLPETVESILKQDFCHFSFYINNNASTDGTKEYLDSLRDSRIRIEHLEHTISRVDVLNYSLSKIDSPYTAVIDADDLADEKRLSSQWMYMEKNPHIHLLGSDIYFIDERTNYLNKRAFPTEHTALVNYFPLTNPFAHAACFYRTDTIKSAGGYPKDVPYAHDMALWIKLIKSGYKIGSLAKYLASIRLHSSQMTQNPTQIKLKQQDAYRLNRELESLEELSLVSRQALLTRNGILLWQMGEKIKSLSTLFQSFSLKPLLFFSNPLFWQRLKMKTRNN